MIGNTYVGNTGDDRIESVQGLEISTAESVPLGYRSVCSSDRIGRSFHCNCNGLDIGKLVFCLLNIVANSSNGYLMEAISIDNVGSDMWTYSLGSSRPPLILLNRCVTGTSSDGGWLE